MILAKIATCSIHDWFKRPLTSVSVSINANLPPNVHYGCWPTTQGHKVYTWYSIPALVSATAASIWSSKSKLGSWARREPRIREILDDNAYVLELSRQFYLHDHSEAEKTCCSRRAELWEISKKSCAAPLCKATADEFEKLLLSGLISLTKILLLKSFHIYYALFSYKLPI